MGGEGEKGVKGGDKVLNSELADVDMGEDVEDELFEEELEGIVDAGIVSG